MKVLVEGKPRGLARLYLVPASLPVAHNPDSYKWVPPDACLEAMVSVATGFWTANGTKGTRKFTGPAPARRTSSEKA